MLFCPVLTKIQSARTTRLSPRSAARFASFASFTSLTSPKSFPLTLFADPHPLTLVASIFYKNTGGRGAAQSWRAPWRTFTACGNKCATASSDSTAPLGLPGKFTMSVFVRTAAVPRESTAVGVCSRPLRRISSEIPGTIRSATACVASGVLSRGPIPVPPVVKRTSTRPESASSRNCSRIFAGSSDTRNAEVTSQPSPRQNATTAGPDKSSRSPLVTESLMVRTATRIRKVSSGDSRRPHRIAIGFIHQPHRFHQEAGRVARRGRLCRGVRGVEIDFKFSRRPQHNFINGVVPFHRTDLRVAALPACNIQFTLRAILPHDQPARLLPHLQRLHQVDHAHLFQSSLNDSRPRRFLLQFFEVQAIHNFFRDAYKVFYQKWLGDEILDAIHQRPQAFLDVRPAGHEQKWNVPRRLPRAQFFEELPAVQAGHFVIAENHIGRCVDDLQQRVRAVRGSLHFANRFKPLHDQFAHQRVIIRKEQLYRFVRCRTHRARLCGAFRRWKSPLFPPVLSVRTMSVISIPLSRALHMS